MNVRTPTRQILLFAAALLFASSAGADSLLPPECPVTPPGWDADEEFLPPECPLTALDADPAIQDMRRAVRVVQASARGDASNSLLPSLKKLYQARRYEEVVRRVATASPEQTAHPRVKVLAALSGLHIDDRQTAQSALRWLEARRGESPSAARYADVVSEEIQRFGNRRELESQISSHLKSFDLEAIRTSIDSSTLDAGDKEVLHAYVDVFGANFDAARRRVPAIRTAASSATAMAIKKMIEERQKTYGKLKSDLDDLLYSGVGSARYVSEAPTRNEGVRYFKLADQFLSLFPFDDRALDLAFHASMFTLDTESFIGFGDAILAQKGKISIPFCDEVHFFDLVIDAREERIYTEPVDRPFVFVNGNNGSVTLARGKVAGRENLDAFSLPFDEIKKIKQNSDRSGATTPMLKTNAYALEINHNEIPIYLMMEWVHMKFGVKAQKEATRRLGEFVAHVLDNPDLRLRLEDPEKIRDGSFARAMMWVGTIASGVSAGLASSQGQSEVANQAMNQAQSYASMLQATDEAREKTNEAQAAWYEVTTKLMFDIRPDYATTDVAQLLGPQT
jgi:hypothetical protein